MFYAGVHCINKTTQSLNKVFVALLAVTGGVLLAFMISLNSQLAEYSNPLTASWVAHGVGMATAMFLVSFLRIKNNIQTGSEEAAPKWAYLGGIPGAFVVVLSAVTVNSDLGLTGTLTLGIVGQTLFGMLCDQYGWFGLNRRQLNLNDCMTVTLVITGSFLVINS